MTPERARERVRGARVARLATVTADGSPHLVPCCFALVDRDTQPGGPPEAPPGSTIYTPIDAKPKTTLALRRLANLRANPRASLLVDHWAADWSALWWVRVDGDARILEAGDAERTSALERLAHKYRQYREVPPPGPVIAIDVVTWRSWP
jgi:PPOX class probable F420-dependent enzyme